MTKMPRAILILFCLLLIVPTAGWLCDLDPFPRATENRTLAERPEFHWNWSAIEKFPDEYEAYFNDNFGLRNALIRANYFFRYVLLGVSPSNQVVAGHDGWLYYTGDGELDDCRGITRFDDEELRRWTQGLIMKRDWLAKRGIRYLLVIPPNKSTIYPEYLPAGYQRVRQKSGLDDFMAFVRQNTDLEVVDLKTILLGQKKEHNLYHRTDTHWNNYGAFLAYQEIIKPLALWFPEITPFKVEDFTVTPNRSSAGDLSDMIGGKEFQSDENYLFTPKKPFTAVVSEKNASVLAPFTMTKELNRLPRVLIFRDSFFKALVPFFAEHFSVSRYIWARWDAQIPMEYFIARYEPQVVIEEVVERLVKGDADIFSSGLPGYLSSPPVGIKAAAEAAHD